MCVCVWCVRVCVCVVCVRVRVRVCVCVSAGGGFMKSSQQTLTDHLWFPLRSAMGLTGRS